MSGFKNTVQLILIVLAGVASFYVSMEWRRSSANGLSPIVKEVTPANRTQFSPTPATSKTAREHDMTLTLPQRTRAVPESSGDAFATMSWLPPPPPVRVAPPPPPPAPVVPVAPPLPFTFVGLMEQSTTRPQAFLSKGDALLVVAAGDLIDNNTYRVDTVNPQQIVMTYLPMNTLQTLNILGTTK